MEMAGYRYARVPVPAQLEGRQISFSFPCTKLYAGIYIQKEMSSLPKKD
jgi:hypothetical protein